MIWLLGYLYKVTAGWGGHDVLAELRATILDGPWLEDMGCADVRLVPKSTVTYPFAWRLRTQMALLWI